MSSEGSVRASCAVKAVGDITSRTSSRGPKPKHAEAQTSVTLGPRFTTPARPLVARREGRSWRLSLSQVRQLQLRSRPFTMRAACWRRFLCSFGPQAAAPTKTSAPTATSPALHLQRLFVRDLCGEEREREGERERERENFGSSRLPATALWACGGFLPS